MCRRSTSSKYVSVINETMGYPILFIYSTPTTKYSCKCIWINCPVDKERPIDVNFNRPQTYPYFVYQYIRAFLNTFNLTVLDDWIS